MLSAAKGVLGRLPVVSPWKWALLLFVLLAVYQVRTLHLDDRLYFWIKTSWHEEAWEHRSLWLPEYRVSIEARAVAGVRAGSTRSSTTRSSVRRSASEPDRSICTIRPCTGP